MSELTISYVLPVYNAQDTIARTLKSLFDQEVKGEIIVIDDGSTDHTSDILRFYKDKIDILISHDKRKGAAIRRNEGNVLAKGDIIAVCDCDQYYKARSTHIIEFFKEHPDKDLFYSALHLKDYNDMHQQYLMEAYEWDFKSKCPISHPTVAYTKKLANTCKYHEKTEESDLYEFMLLDAHKKGFIFGGSNNPLMLKIEGDSKRDVSKGRDIKRSLYSEYGIKLNG